MKIDIITIFPNMFQSPFSESIIKRAIDKKLVQINIHNLRDWTKDKHRTVDDKPYGGGPGMVLKVDIIDAALQDLKSPTSKIILLTPSGKLFNQKIAQKFAKEKHLILICGRYEGCDARVEKLVNEQISIGDYILSGGELAAAVVIDAIIRLLPGAVGKKESVQNESFVNKLLDYPVYTRPEVYKKMRVPKILLSGNHQEIQQWRHQKAKEKTQKFRPDLLKKAPL